jgi:hypothetical protein
MREIIEELLELLRLEKLQRATPNYSYEAAIDNTITELRRLAEKVDDQIVELRCRTNKY